MCSGNPGAGRATGQLTLPRGGSRLLITGRLDQVDEVADRLAVGDRALHQLTGDGLALGIVEVPGIGADLGERIVEAAEGESRSSRSRCLLSNADRISVCEMQSERSDLGRELAVVEPGALDRCEAPLAVRALPAPADGTIGTWT